MNKDCTMLHWDGVRATRKDGTDYNIYTTILFNPNYTIKDYIGYIKNSETSFEPYIDFI